MCFKLATWNINSVRLRVDLVSRFLREESPDVLCLQEIKCQDSQFPYDVFRNLGWEWVAVRGQKGYHGVAILSRYPFSLETSTHFCKIEEARHVSVALILPFASLQVLHVHNFYVPAGGDEPDPSRNSKFAHKLAFLTEMREWCAQQELVHSPHLMVGDFNVAPLEHDVWSHKALLSVVSHTPEEVALLTHLQQAGQWIDTPRLFTPASQKLYSWWSYRSPNWQKANKGRRLDHIWASPFLKDFIHAAAPCLPPRGWDRPSDHVPVILKLGGLGQQLPST